MKRRMFVVAVVATTLAAPVAFLPSPAFAEQAGQGFFKRLFKRQQQEKDEQDTREADRSQQRISASYVKVRTEPPGGTVTVVETADAVRDGESIGLPAGDYTLRADKAGYHSGTLKLRADGKQDILVTVPLGAGYAHVAFDIKPGGATVFVNEKSRGNAPLELKLDAGEYAMGARAPGYYSDTRRFRVIAGEDLQIAFALRQVTNQALVTVEIQPVGSTILFDGREQGTDRAALGYVDFGPHTLSGIKPLDEVTRLTGARKWVLSKIDPVTVSLTLASRQRLFEGRWMPEADAVQAEEERYRRQRVPRPVDVRVPLGTDAGDLLAKVKDLDSALMTVMRVGDRITFAVAGKRTVQVWKRHDRATRAFRGQIRALATRTVPASSFAADETVVRTRAAQADVAAIGYALHRARAAQPLLDLRRAQLDGSGETVYRSMKDGPLTILARTPGTLASAGIEFERAGSLLIAQVRAGSEVIALRWDSAPDRLLVIGDTNAALAALPVDVTLRKFEKRIITLAEGPVSHVARLTGDVKGKWRRETFTASGPMAELIDLRRDEIGPHDAPGRFSRIWIVRVAGASGETQRQLTMNYTVATDAKPLGTDQFLRR